MEFLRYVLKAFVPLFTAASVFSVLPLYLSLTEGLTEAERRSIDRQSIFTALAAGLAFVAVGQSVFFLLGITMADFQVAGGLLLLILGVLDLTMGRMFRFGDAGAAMGVVPIGMPLIVGPAQLTTLLVLTTTSGYAHTIAAVLTAFCLNLLLLYLSFRFSEKLIRVLGVGGLRAMGKVVALLLAAIGVMLIRRGLTTMITEGSQAL